jgi:hypothetical protein
MQTQVGGSFYGLLSLRPLQPSTPISVRKGIANRSAQLTAERFLVGADSGFRPLSNVEVWTTCSLF